MDELRTLLDSLDGVKLAYVYARSRTGKRIEAIRESGMSKSAFYELPEDEQDRLDELADQVRRNRVIVAEPKLHDAIEKAVDVLVGLLSADSEYVKLEAAKSIIERVMGKVPQKVDVPGDGQIAIAIIKMPIDEL